MCFPCHEEYNRTLNPPLKDCHGINCPLGIPHPPPNKNPREGGVFPLGCGICRSEKLEILQNRDVQQVVSEDNLPKHYVPDRYRGGRKELKIDRPLVEIEVPDFIALADELLQAEIERERERIRILNKTPVPVMTPAQRRKKEKALKKKQRKQEDCVPNWFLNPLNDAEEDQYEGAAAAAVEEAQIEEPEAEAVPHLKVKKAKVYKVCSEMRPRRLGRKALK